jgi:hypothetical protein
MPRYLVHGLAAAMAFALGCADEEYIQSGRLWIPKSAADHEFPSIKRRASFDLRCQPEELVLETLAVYQRPEEGRYPTQVGVSGCGKRVVYVAGAHGDWTMDPGGVSTEAPVVRRRVREDPEGRADEPQAPAAEQQQHVRLVRVTPGAEVKLLRYSADRKTIAKAKLIPEGLWTGAPLKIDFPAGERWTVVATLPGHQDFVRNLEFPDGVSEITISIELEKAGRASP